MAGLKEPQPLPFWRIPISDVRPTPGHLITTAASLRLGHLLRHRLRQRVFTVQELLPLSHVPVLKDAWCERASTSQFSKFKIIQSPKEAFSSTVSNGGGAKEASGNEGVANSEPSRKNGSNPRKLTDVLFAANVLAYAAQCATRGKLTYWGAKINRLIDKGQWWRLVTCNFLHGNVVHLLLNSHCLNSVGPIVETICGPRRYLAVYFISAIAGSTMSYKFCKSPSLSASGAIFGLVASFTVYIMRHWDLTGGTIEELQAVVRFIAINMAIGVYFNKRIDNWAHLGGFVGGAAATWFVGPAWKDESENVDGHRVFRNRAPITYLLNTNTEYTNEVHWFCQETTP